MYVDHRSHSKPHARERSGFPEALRSDRELFLKIFMSAMPLMGLVLGVTGLALWNAG
jgi:hypothetical protein